VKPDARLFTVTIIRPQTDELQEEVCIGFAQLAKVIAQRIRAEERMGECTAPLPMIELVQGSKEG